MYIAGTTIWWICQKMLHLIFIVSFFYFYKKVNWKGKEERTERFSKRLRSSNKTQSNLHDSICSLQKRPDGLVTDPFNLEKLPGKLLARISEFLPFVFFMFKYFIYTPLYSKINELYSFRAFVVFYFVYNMHISLFALHCLLYT